MIKTQARQWGEAGLQIGRAADEVAVEMSGNSAERNTRKAC